MSTAVATYAGPYYGPSARWQPFLGDDAAVDIDQTPWWDIGAQLSQAQQQMNEVLGAMQADSTLAAAIGRDATKAQADLGTALSEYNRIAGLLGAPTLSGVLVPAYLAAAIVALAGLTAIAIYEVSQVFQSYQQNQTKQQALSQAQTILQQANQAAAAGNAPLAAQLYAQYQAAIANAPGSTTFMDFLNKNGAYIMVALVAAVLLKR